MTRERHRGSRARGKDRNQKAQEKESEHRNRTRTCRRPVTTMKKKGERVCRRRKPFGAPRVRPTASMVLTRSESTRRQTVDTREPHRRSLSAPAILRGRVTKRISVPSFASLLLRPEKPQHSLIKLTRHLHPSVALSVHPSGVCVKCIYTTRTLPLHTHRKNLRVSVYESNPCGNTCTHEYIHE